MVIVAPRWDEPRFQAWDSWVTLAIELLRRKEFEQRGINSQTVCNIFPLHHAPHPPLPLAATQAPPLHPTPNAPTRPSAQVL